MPEITLQKPSKWAILRRIFSTAGKGSFVGGMIIGALGTVITGATGLPFIGLPSFIAAMGSSTAGFTKLAILIGTALGCAGISIGTGLAVGFVLGAALGITLFLVKRHHDRKKAAAEAAARSTLVVEHEDVGTRNAADIGRQLNPDDPAAGVGLSNSTPVIEPALAHLPKPVEQTPVNQPISDKERKDIYGLY